MITEVKIPAVGESITTGVVSTWHKKRVKPSKAAKCS